MTRDDIIRAIVAQQWAAMILVQCSLTGHSRCECWGDCREPVGEGCFGAVALAFSRLPSAVDLCS